LKFIDPDGRCSAPAGIKSGQIGICIGSYISAKRIGLVGQGNDRGPVGNDPKATFKAQVQIVVEPSKASIESARTEAGMSAVYIGGVGSYGRPGTASSEISTPTVDSNGNIHLTVSTTATNGLSFLPFAPKESIDLSIQLTVTPEGAVGVEGGTRDGYPSLEVFWFSRMTRPAR